MKPESLGATETEAPRANTQSDTPIRENLDLCDGIRAQRWRRGDLCDVAREGVGERIDGAGTNGCNGGDSKRKKRIRRLEAYVSRGAPTEFSNAAWIDSTGRCDTARGTLSRADGDGVALQEAGGG